MLHFNAKIVNLHQNLVWCYVPLKTLLNEVHTYIFLYYTVDGICWRL